LLVAQTNKKIRAVISITTTCETDFEKLLMVCFYTTAQIRGHETLVTLHITFAVGRANNSSISEWLCAM
jgi:hypothetical protein